jgi:hypothetical protein
MSRFASGAVTSAGSTTLPMFSMYGSAAGRPYINEIGIFNTTSTAVSIRLVRLSTTGTRGTTITPSPLSQEDLAPSAGICYNTHTVAPTIAGDLGFRTVLGASVGSGVIWTWPDRVLTISAGVNAGIGIVVESGTGQPLSVYWEHGE